MARHDRDDDRREKKIPKPPGRVIAWLGKSTVLAVTVTNFNDEDWVSIRKFFYDSKVGAWKPAAGVSIRTSEWDGSDSSQKLRDAVDYIDDKIAAAGTTAKRRRSRDEDEDDDEDERSIRRPLKKRRRD